MATHNYNARLTEAAEVFFVHETNVPGLYVAGHFTHARHIKEAIAVPRRVVPLIAQSLRAAV